MTRRSAIRPFLGALAFGALGCASFAQKSDTAIQADLDFAKGLAEEWQFVNLAEEVLRGIESGGVSARRAEELALVKCDIFRSAALTERNRLRRNELFDRALKAYIDFVDRYRTSERRWEAEIGLVRTASLFARSIEISLDEVLGEEALKLQEQRLAVLNDAVSRTQDLVESLRATPNRTESQTRELADLMLTRARMLYDIARSQEDGTFNFEQAFRTAEALVYIVGEGTPAALRAFDLIGRIKAAQQDWDEAVGYFQAVVETAIPPDLAEWQQLVREQALDKGAKEQRWLFLELSAGELAAAHASHGDLTAATRVALHYYNTQRREGFSFSPSLGYPTLLKIARVLLESGGWIGGNIATGDAKWYESEEAARADHARRNVLSTAELALRIATQVKDENQGNILQLLSQKLISEISNLPGITVEPDMLLQAAQGEYHGGNFAGSIEALQRLLAIVATKDDATRLRLGGEICWWMGRNFQRMDRMLEAAMCFREGVTAWQGDPNFDAQNAQNFYRAIEQVRAADREAPAYAALFREAENLSTRFATGNKDDILYAQAERERTAGRFDAAIEKYKEIEAGADVYERALVGIAECTYRKGNVDEAARLFDEYVERYVTDPRRSVADSPVRQRNRAEAMAKAEFYRPFIAAERARATPTDLDGWRRVVELARSYHERYPAQTVLAPWCLDLTFEGQLALRQLEEMRETYGKLASDYPDSPRTARNAVRFYGFLAEQKQAAEAAQDVERARALELEMATLLETGNRLASSPTYANLRSESTHWMALGRFDKAEPLLRRIVQTFEQSGSDAEREGIRRYVRPDLGLTLLSMGRAGEARQVLEPLATDEKNAPSRDTVIGYCRSLVGWIEFDGERPRRVPGAAETAAELQAAINLYAKLDKLADSWGCEWYAYKFQIALAYHVWATADGGPKDAAQLDPLRRQLGQITLETGPTFDDVGKKCDAAGARAAQAIHGPGDLRAKFRWLQDRAQ